MTQTSKVIVGCTHGDEDADRVTVAYLTATAALNQGKEVVMWLTVEGVRLATAGYVDPIQSSANAPAVKSLHEQFVAGGGRYYVCPICFEARELAANELVDGAEIKGATPLMEFAGDSAMTFNY